MTSTIDARKDAMTNSTYDVYIDIDVDCEELLDAIGLEYTTSEDDEHQNEVKLILDKDEYYGSFGALHLDVLNERFIGEMLLNPELGEYVTRVQIYKPSGDKITFE